ncbi:response regulator [Acinetobacter sp. ANC 5054]|uniref:GGDEF domain-containing protein n=1 Tax=Acinetobacter sp. ANC 5054 TaxID=1977877 RepID=UPI000A32D027|nr:GGDEF domain-containing protein [Acinetobacter sp. ANC 5054]OTG79740.1 response regulator [Acinetobacter sp. ANC 5054]
MKLHLNCLTPPTTRQSIAFVLIAAIIFCFCLIGILSRPLTFLAIFWPANAVLLSLFLRFPNLSNAGGWLGAFTGYMLADLLTGNHFQLTLFLTFANLINTIISLFFMRYFQVNYHNYNKGFTFLTMIAIIAGGGCLASATFAIFTVPYIPNTFMTTNRLFIDFGMWWITEIMNALIMLPLILSMPTLLEIKNSFRNRRPRALLLNKFFPAIAVALCVLLTSIFTGPGAILYPLAALIWAALSYQLFTLAVINAVVILATYYNLNNFYLADSSVAYLSTAISVRIGLTMLILAPLILCVISRNRHDLFKEVLYLANHDSLTHAMNRRYFFEQGEKYLNSHTELTFSIIMLDIDHFKRLNDQHGHYIGDVVLQRFSDIVRDNLREDDLFARIGGEEFVILLSNIQAEDAHNIAERIRNVVEITPIKVDNTNELFITVSIGINHQNLPDAPNLQYLINQADQALYQAKQTGRNQVVLALA